MAQADEEVIAMWFDTHAHVEGERFDEDRPEVIERAAKAGVNRFVNIGTDEESIQQTMMLIEEYDQVYGAVGIHPHAASSVNDALVDTLRQCAAHPKILAIGEIGLDYHYDYAPKDVQRSAFRQQIRLAKELSMPILIHDREAHRECLDILTEEDGWACGGIFHCYSGSAETASEIVGHGFYISFTGVLTFPNAKNVRRAAAEVPLYRLLVETDCPYLSPQTYRGKRNEPAYVVETGRALAELRGISYEEMASITWENACKVYRIDSREGGR